jgi:2-isopropylmalate synthase
MLAVGGRAWELDALSTTSGTGTLPCASIALRAADGTRFQEAAAGDGPVDAVYRAIEKVTGISVKLRNYEISSVTTGEDALGEVAIEVEHATGVYRGRALSTDIIEGSARAFLDVVNRIALRMSPRVSEARAEMGTP